MSAGPVASRPGHRPALGALALGVILVGLLALGAVASVGARMSAQVSAEVSLLIVLAVLCVPVVTYFAWHQRLLEPLSLVAFITLTSFVGRPLQFLAWRHQFFSNTVAADQWGADGLVNLNAQEIVLYVQVRLVDSFDVAVARALVACVVFFVAILVGYWIGPGRRVLDAVAGAGARFDADRRQVRCARIDGDRARGACHPDRSGRRARRSS
jgi:hypothetical protein